MRNAEYYKNRIAMLSEDIAMFGPAGDDLKRLAEYRRELAEIEYRTTDSKDAAPGLKTNGCT
jgi:hypothetical protein